MGTKAVVTGVNALTSIAQTAILAHLLNPESFGLVAMAMIVICGFTPGGPGTVEPSTM